MSYSLGDSHGCKHAFPFSVALPSPSEEPPYSLGPCYSLGEGHETVLQPGRKPWAGARLSLPSPCHACRAEPPYSLGPSYSLGDSHGREHASPSSFALPRLQGGAALQPGTIRQSARELACRATAWEGPEAALD